MNPTHGLATLIIDRGTLLERVSSGQGRFAIASCVPKSENGEIYMLALMHAQDISWRY